MKNPRQIVKIFELGNSYFSQLKYLQIPSQKKHFARRILFTEETHQMQHTHHEDR